MKAEPSYNAALVAGTSNHGLHRREHSLAVFSTGTYNRMVGQYGNPAEGLDQNCLVASQTKQDREKDCDS